MKRRPTHRTMHTSRNAVGLFLATVVLGALAALPACGSAPTRSATPMLDTRNPEVKLSKRLTAADQAWENVQTDPADRAKAREIFKSIVWSDATPTPLRRKLADYLLTDDSPQGLEDSKAFTMLRLPTEPDRSIVGMMALAAARNGWQDAAPALVRALADPVQDIPDDERVEALALQRLFPGQSLERIAFDIFLGNTPGAGPSPAPTGTNELFAERARADAWTVLSRLDPSGDARRDLIANPGLSAAGPASSVLADLRAANADLRIVPSTGMELEWLARLREPDERLNRDWWSRVSSLVARLSNAQAEGLELRHLEPIRLAAQTEPALLGMSRVQLFGLLERRLENRPRNRRTAELDGRKGRSPERPEDWSGQLTWGDLLSILVIDDAVSTPEFARVMLQQAELDRNDKKTEYGGVVEAVNAPDGSLAQIRAVLFPPRPRDRVGDEQFIASRDMLIYSDRALAHYHLQVQREKNYKYAGPSSGDLRYARLSGRSCVVFTSLGADRLGVDYYQPDGATIDLGEIRPEE
jgi:hypothetical protein